MPPTQSPNKKRSLSLDAYEAIRGRIIDGTYVPGKVLTEQVIAAEVNLGRTPVREAIRRLQHEGLVQQVPRWGTVVRRVQRREVAELFELLELVQTRAARRAAKWMDAATVDHLAGLFAELMQIVEGLRSNEQAEALDEEEARKWMQLDSAFHMLIVRSCRSRTLIKSTREVRDRTRIAMNTVPTFDLPVLSGLLEHQQAVLEALQAKDPRAAGRSMRRNVHHRARLVRGLFEENGKRKRGGPIKSFFHELANLEEKMDSGT